MLALMAISSLAAIFVVYFLMPALWLHIMSVDDSLDAHEAGLTLVASRMFKACSFLLVALCSYHLRQPISRNGTPG